MLLIDCGNSALKCRLIQQQSIRDERFNLTLQSDRQAFSEFLSVSRANEVYVASVASAVLTKALMTQLQQTLPLARVSQIYTQSALGEVINAYADYTRLGVDRWLTLLAAQQRESADVIIIDAGSAITIDLLSRRQSHLGGAILPGFNTDRQRFIEMFPLVDFKHPDISQDRRPGRSTESCIQISEFPVTSQRVLQLICDWKSLLEEPVKILLCGQDARLISEQMSLPYEIVADLVFQGMLQQIQLQG